MLWKNQSKQIDLPLAGGATGRILKSEPEALLVSAHSREAMIKVSQWARASGKALMIRQLVVVLANRNHCRLTLDRQRD